VTVRERDKGESRIRDKWHSYHRYSEHANDSLQPAADDNSWTAAAAGFFPPCP